MDDVPGQAMKNRIVRFLKRRRSWIKCQARDTVAPRRAGHHSLRQRCGTGQFREHAANPSVSELAAGSA